MSSAVRTVGLTKRYGDTAALQGVTLDVRAGSVFGYLGSNGAGKSTTIRLLLGLVRPTAGHAEVFGLDATAERDRVHARVGYLPGVFAPYLDLTAEQCLRYLGGLRGGVDWAYVQVLAKRLDLALDRRIGTLSHGNRQKVGLVQAFMHRPDLIVLDEPTLGLDPLMQQEFRALVREHRDAGTTVFLSSHELDEVDAVADEVAILRAGRLVTVEPVAALKTNARRRIELTFEGPAPTAALAAAAGVADLRVDGSRVFLTVAGSMDALFRAAAPSGIRSVVTHEADLEDVFLDYYRKAG